MPYVSKSQERLMQAAAHTSGGYGGVPQSVGKEFTDCKSQLRKDMEAYYAKSQLRKDMEAYYATRSDADEKWITTETGSHIKLGEDGTVLAGMGGKFNGKNIKDVHGTEKFTSGETNAETEERNKKQENKSNLPIDNGANTPHNGTLNNKTSEGSKMENLFNSIKQENGFGISSRYAQVVKKYPELSQDDFIKSAILSARADWAIENLDRKEARKLVEQLQSESKIPLSEAEASLGKSGHEKVKQFMESLSKSKVDTPTSQETPKQELSAKDKVMAKFEEKYGKGNVKIYPNGSIFANKILQGELKDFAKEFEPTSEQKNAHQMMNSGYGKYD